jgi:hypothetical protein
VAGQIPYKDYCLESKVVKANPVLIYYGFRQPRDWQIARGGNWGGTDCGFVGPHELRVVWRTTSGVDREERVDLRRLLPKTVDASQHPGQVFVQDPFVVAPRIRVEVEDRELRVVFEAKLWYVGEPRPDGLRPHSPVTLTKLLFSNGENAR